VQTDQSTDSATVTTRRAFLTRAAVGSAVAAGALALPVGALVTGAGAQSGEGIGELRDEAFAAFAAPLELAAVQAYNVAVTSEKLDREWAAQALVFQSHHRTVADAIIEMGDANAEAPVADAEFSKAANDAIASAADQNAVLLALADVEETLAATHLAAVAQLREVSTAKTVTQVLAVEGQQAALLAVAGGSSIESVTPATNTGDAAVTIPADAGTTTTTTEAN
jgi:hypothetical protein